MAEPFLKPGERRKFSEAVAACSRCRDRLKYMSQIGIPTAEYEARAKAVENSIQGALEIDRMTQAESENG